MKIKRNKSAKYRRGIESDGRRTQEGLARAERLEDLLKAAKAGASNMGPTKTLREIARLANYCHLGELAAGALAASVKEGCGLALRLLAAREV